MISASVCFPAAEPTFGLSLRRIRELLAHHRRQVEEGERAFREWQAEWWVRERVIDEHLRRIEQQVTGIPRPVPRLSVVRVESAR
jgi:hypothetical protein